jgi:hypothetical protein
MDRLLSIGSPPPQWQARALSGSDTEPFALTPADSQACPTPLALLDPVRPDDPAEEKGQILQFMSHIDATCFISLLQILDPMPDDYRARAEYRRHYRQLHETLEIPAEVVSGR